MRGILTSSGQEKTGFPPSSGHVEAIPVESPWLQWQGTSEQSRRSTGKQQRQGGEAAGDFLVAFVSLSGRAGEAVAGHRPRSISQICLLLPPLVSAGPEPALSLIGEVLFILVSNTSFALGAPLQASQSSSLQKQPLVVVPSSSRL